MQDFTTVTGIVLKTEPIMEYDKRVVILTKEKGKISAFAKGCRKPGNRLMAVANPFSFGEFRLYAGKSSYNIMEANVKNYFDALRKDFDAAYMGMYFLEVADYYTRENLDAIELMRLLYQSLRALESGKYDHSFVRMVFEIKSIVINGEFPGVPEHKSYLDDTVYALSYIEKSGIEKLFSFEVSDEVQKELIQIAQIYCNRFHDKHFASLDIIEGKNPY